MPINRLKNQITRLWFFYIKSKDQKTFYRLSGMRRSGNHAVINWVLKQLHGATCYNNNMGPFHPPENTIIKKIKFRGFSKFNLLVSLEDKWCKDAFLNYDFFKFGKSRQKYNVLILRDPYNMFASRWVWKDEFGILFREDLEHQKMIIEIWKEHARTYIQWQNGQEFLNCGKGIAINYNRWFRDKKYRNEIANQLGLRFTDAGKEDITNYGHGSSFDGRDLHKQASNLKVLERWKGTIDDPKYRMLFEDVELRELARSIFETDDIEVAFQKFNTL